MKKFNNKKKGKFRSLLEFSVNWQLIAKKRKIKFKHFYELDKLFYGLVTVKDQKVVIVPRTYNPDFTIINKDGTRWFLEVKGYFPEEQREKMLAVKNDWSEDIIRFYFAKDNYIRGRRGPRYSDWCIKHGFEYCVGQLPEEWFNGSTN
jgi:hypothetical protein